MAELSGDADGDDVDQHTAGSHTHVVRAHAAGLEGRDQEKGGCCSVGGSLAMPCTSGCCSDLVSSFVKISHSSLLQVARGFHFCGGRSNVLFPRGVKNVEPENEYSLPYVSLYMRG